MLCEIMKASGDVPKSNYCKVLSQKCRQVFKPLARVMLRALIVLFDVISHHEQRNPSYMINCAVFKTPCMLKSFFSCCHQKKKKILLICSMNLLKLCIVLSSTVWGLEGDVCERSPGVPCFPPRQVDFTSSAFCGIQRSWQYHIVVQLFVARVQLEPHFSLGS